MSFSRLVTWDCIACVSWASRLARVIISTFWETLPAPGSFPIHSRMLEKLYSRSFPLTWSTISVMAGSSVPAPTDAVFSRSKEFSRSSVTLPSCWT